MSALTFLDPAGLAVPTGYSHAVLAGGMVHVAGQVALDAEGQTVGVGDFAQQAERALANFELALAAAGTTFGAVAALTIYCAAAVQRPQLLGLRAALRSRVGTARPPAITLVFVHSLMDPDWLVEVQGLALACPVVPTGAGS